MRRGRMIKAAFCATVLAGLAGASITFARPADAPALETLRQNGDLAVERRHVWGLIASFTVAKNDQPLFQSWHGEGELFSGAPSGRRGLAGFSRTGIAGPQSTDVPVLTYTLYNDAAFQHIIRNHLNETDALDRLRRSGAADDEAPGDRDVPAFPADSPCAQNGLVASGEGSHYRFAGVGWKRQSGPA